MYRLKYLKYRAKYMAEKINQNGGTKTKKDNSMNTIMSNLKKYISENMDYVNIIAMGEATHGQNKIANLRLKMFKYLVKNHGYTVFVLEEQYSTCELINDWIRSESEYDLDDIIFDLMWPWKSVSMYHFLGWMRKYNKMHNNVLEFKGVDVQFANSKYVKSKTGNGCIAGKLDKFVTFANKIMLLLQIAYDKNPDDEMAGFELRDKLMFKMFMKMYEPGKKYFIYAHNGHIEKKYFIESYKNFGYHLDKKFGPKYLAIGNSFDGDEYYGGNPVLRQFQIATFNTPIDLAEVNIYNDVTDTFEHLDLSNNLKLPPGLTTNKMVNFGEKYIVNTGTAVDADNPYKYLVAYPIQNRFDAVIVIPNEKALQLYPRKNNKMM